MDAERNKRFITKRAEAVFAVRRDCDCDPRLKRHLMVIAV
jgi:hypothetical protein